MAGDGALYGFLGSYSARRDFFRSSLDGQLTLMPASNSFTVSKTFLGRDGNIYGLADFNNQSPEEALVRVTLDGTFSTVFDFRTLGDINPISVFQAASGDFYVLSSTLGTTNSGKVLRITSAGVATTVFEFAANNAPTHLVPGDDGNFYGVLWVNPSSASRSDSIFRLSPDGAFTVVHTFDPGSEGHALYNSLATGPDGALYGLCSHGSVQVALFRVTLTGEMTVFSDDMGFDDLGDFVLAPDGNFYTARTSVFDGNNGAFLPGSIYRISPNGTFSVVHQFQTDDAAGPHPSDLVLGPDGNIYGASSDGGGGGGTLFRLTIATGAVTPIHSFALELGETSALTEGPDGKLYGSVKYGGTHNNGYIFRISPAGVVEKVVDFDGNNGASPVAKLLLASDGNLYGTTDGGGPFFGSKNNGTIFQLTPAGVLTTLFSFDSSGAQGQLPRTRLTEGADGKLYGIAQFGGAADLGTVFRISKTGVFELLNSFPSGHEHTVTPLTLGQDGNFYCLTEENRLPAAILRVTPEGVITQLTELYRQSPPNTFETTLIAAPDGALYGVLTGWQEDQSVFRCTLDGTITTLAHFQDVFITDIILATDGNFYFGRYPHSGPRLLARVTPSGITTSIATFPPGPAPARNLTQSSDGLFYGVGAANIFNGSIFRAELLAPTLTSVTATGGSGSSEQDLVGTSLSNASRVTFGGQPATQFTIVSRTEIRATAPVGADLSAVSVTTPAGIATWPAGSVPPGPALNISTRGYAGPGDDTLIGGFIIQGSAAKKVILRAIGPSLAALGVPNAMADPVLELRDGSGALVETNDDWPSSPEKQAIIDSGIAPTDIQESAILRTLNPGNYTAVVRGAGNGTGVGLIEVYDLDPASGKLANISTRGSVRNGDNVMIGGFIIGGDAPGRVLVRALGPSLANANPPIPNALADPRLELRNSDGELMASSDNWQEGVQAGQISETMIAPSDPKEAALVAPLNPGNYTAIVRGVNDTTGIALVEIYKLD